MGLLEWTGVFGNVGEFVGAFAVVATLFYLAVQVRQSKLATEENTRSILVQAGRNMAFRHSDWHREIATHPDLIALFNKSTAAAVEDFDADEWNRFRFMAVSYMHNIEGQYVSRALDQGFAEQDDGYLRAARTLIAEYP